MKTIMFQIWIGRLSFMATRLICTRSDEKTTDDFIIVYLSNDSSDFELELTWLKEHPQPYDLGECEFHLAFKADDFDSAHKKHEEMGCICFENPEMGIYFIEDPDGYWLEILP